MTPVDWQPGSNYISTVVNRARGGEETKWLKRKTHKETTWGIKGRRRSQPGKGVHRSVYLEAKV